MFEEAVKCSRGRRRRGLEPFWVYDGSARIERHVPVLPLSREVERLVQLRRSLAAYRDAARRATGEDRHLLPLCWVT
jgi:hypothetical protein